MCFIHKSEIIILFLFLICKLGRFSNSYAATVFKEYSTTSPTGLAKLNNCFNDGLKICMCFCIYLKRVFFKL